MRDDFGYNAGTNLAWHLTGDGFDKLGLFRLPKPTIKDDQLLVRQEIVTVCFSSVKEILAGNKHPRLQGRDLSKKPVVLGDETFIVIEEVGRNLRGKFKEGEGYVVVPDLGTSAFGYDINGGLTRYNVLEGRILDYLLPVDMEVVNRLGMFAVTLSEPFSCVEKSYNLGYRRGIKENGIALFVSVGAPEGMYEITKVIEESHPKKILVVNISTRCDNEVRLPHAEAELLRAHAEKSAIEFVRLDSLEDVIKMAEAHGKNGFDDIIIFGDESKGVSRAVDGMIPHLAKGGILNIIGDIPKGTPILLDIGRTHYDDTLIVGTTGPDRTPLNPPNKWGEESSVSFRLSSEAYRNQANIPAAYSLNSDYELKASSTVVLIGAGGPMGQMHLLRALRNQQSPAKIIAVDVDDNRLSKLNSLRQYALKDTELVLMNPNRKNIDDVLDGNLIDYLVLLAPVGKVIEDYAPYFARNAIINVFAGLKGQKITLDAYLICKKNLRVVGHSGTDVESQRTALQKIMDGTIVTGPVISAVGGMNAAWDAMWAAYMGTYPGKIALYLWIDFPLTEVSKITGGDVWSAEYERELLKNCSLHSPTTGAFAGLTVVSGKLVIGYHSLTIHHSPIWRRT